MVKWLPEIMEVAGGYGDCETLLRLVEVIEVR